MIELTLEYSIRQKVMAQHMISPVKRGGSVAFAEMLDLAWWVSGKYGINSRIRGTSNPVRRLLREGMIRPIINNTYRISTVPLFIAIMTYSIDGSTDEEIIDALKELKSCTSIELARFLNIDTKNISLRLRKEQKNYNVVLYQDKYWHWEIFQSKFGCQIDGIDLLELTEDDTIKLLIVRALERYPLLTIDQLSYLLQLQTVKLLRPLSQLKQTGKLVRGITRIDNPDEIISIHSKFEEVDIELWQTSPNFLLEKRDALVELIKLERYFKFKNGDYWFFMEGLPQAEFDLQKKDKKYKLKNFSMFSTSNQSQDEIINGIKQWAGSEKITVIIDIDDEYSQLAIKFIDILNTRGYVLNGEMMVMQKSQIKPTKSSRRIVKRRYSWHSLRHWYREKQYLSTSTTNIDEVVKNLVQIDDINSLNYRLGGYAEQFKTDETCYIPGINQRFGFVHRDNVEDILLAFPRHGDIKYLDSKILGRLDTAQTIDQLARSLGILAPEVKNLMLSLERKRMVRRDLNTSINTGDCSWIIFSHNMKGLRKSNDSGSESSVANIIVRLLARHIPLTLHQLSQLIGLTTKEIEPIRKNLLSRGTIIEGYYLEEEKDIQLTLPSIIDELQELEELELQDSSSLSDIDLLPFSDAVSQVYLNTLMELHPELQPRKRYVSNSEWWMILWQGEPAGYLVKSPTEKSLFDYEISIRIHNNMATNPVIGGVLQKLVSIFKLWFDDELFIADINGLSLGSDIFEPIHFLAGTLGFI